MGKGKAIKDLGRLNRDLSRVVLIASDDTVRTQNNVSTRQRERERERERESAHSN